MIYMLMESRRSPDCVDRKVVTARERTLMRRGVGAVRLMPPHSASTLSFPRHRLHHVLQLTSKGVGELAGCFRG